VLHPRSKWKYFEDHWTGSQASFVIAGKRQFKRLWESKYKTDNLVPIERSPEPARQSSFINNILDSIAPTVSTNVPRPTARHDQLHWYLQEPPVRGKGLMEYWRSRESEWPQLASMAHDFLSIPAMSSECERVFSSCAKQTTQESSKLSGTMLWHQECLSNWHRRGAVKLDRAWGAIQLA
jgi:hypothetical protein